MPAEEEITTITVSATTPDSLVKEPTNAESEKSTTTEPIGQTTETTENEETREEAKKNEAAQVGSKSKEDENKENVQQNDSEVEPKKGTGAVEKKGKAEANGQTEARTEGIALRKRQTPDKKDSKDEDVSPPKKVK